MNKTDKIKVVLLQLGSPDELSVPAVRRYLAKFLSDHRVVDLPRWLWLPILYLFILPFRPRKTLALYQRLVNMPGRYQGTFPLVQGTITVAKELNERTESHIEVEPAFILGKPSIEGVLACWKEEDIRSRAQKVLVLPQFPQFAESTIASGVDQLFKCLQYEVNIPHLEIITSFHRAHFFIDYYVRAASDMLSAKKYSHLVISFHGIQKRRVSGKKDLYYLHCLETFEILKQKIEGVFPGVNTLISFQSRFGSEEWLTPYTQDVLLQLAENKSSILVICASFVTDCLETLDEIGTELKHEVESIPGASLDLVPCPNDEPQYVAGMKHFLETLISGTLTEKNALYYPAPEFTDLKSTHQADKLLQCYHTREDVMPKKTLKSLFLTVFLDIMSFSIIFPLFPHLAAYYLKNDQDSYLLQLLMTAVNSLSSLTGVSSEFSSVVLFGGLMGTLYSLTQFVAAPIWGKWSDQLGRRPILLYTIFGLTLSYLGWMMSFNFTLLVLFRFLGGVCSGNISVATAAVADVTSAENRSKGMSYIGIAFALGFIAGPMLGGIFAAWDLSHIPFLNPFSAVAGVAFLLSLFNWLRIYRSFPETLSLDLMKSNLSTQTTRTSSLKTLMRPFKNPAVNMTNLLYFAFITVFSGMEFTLTFLTFERYNYSPMQNAYLFLFIGVVLSLVQGGYVRRKASIVGEEILVWKGLIFTSIGMIILGLSNQIILSYLGLLFLSTGSAMIIPCLTSLVSIYVSKDEQGEVIGIFRSIGALGRGVGPLSCAIFWGILGSTFTYLLMGTLVLLLIYIAFRLPPSRNFKNAS